MKKNFIKKLLIGGLITSICLCCCFLNFNKNVNASAVNTYQEQNNWFEDSTFLPTDLSSINDLKGKTFSFTPYFGFSFANLNFHINIEILERDYIGIEINEQTHETIQCVDYLQYPYLIFSTYDIFSDRTKFSVFSFYQESDNTYEILFNNDVALNQNSAFQLNGSFTSQLANHFTYLALDNINEKNDIPFGFFSTSNVNGLQYLATIYNIDFLNEENFLNNINNVIPGFTSFYFCFPNTDRYTLTYYENGTISTNFTTFNSFLDFIQPYNANIEDANKRYQVGYNDGYYVGQRDALDDTYRLPFLTGIFNAVSDILALEIYPNVRLGYFILIPLALGITGMLFWFWRKD